MATVYTTEALQTMKIAEMKAIAAANGLEVAPGQNKSYKSTWLDLLSAAIVEVEAGTVTPEEFAAFESPAQVPDVEATPEASNDLEEILKDAIAAAADAEQDAINRNDWEAARTYSDQGDRLLEQYKNYLQHQIDRLAINSMDIPQPASVLWYSAFVGVVSVDRGDTVRAFRVLDAATDQPVVMLQTSSGIELDSRWITTAGNRYIKAVLAALPAQLEKVTAAMFSGAEVVATLRGAIRCGEGNGDGERPRGGGRGDGRQDRLVCVERGGGRRNAIMLLTYDVPDGF